MKIAMVSMSATSHVAEVSAALARCGHEVSVFTRRTDRDVAERVETPQGYTVVHLPAGPREHVPDEELLTHVGPFAQNLVELWSDDRPDVTHAHFWTSGIAAQLAARHLNLPAVQTFHGLGVVERRHLGAQDTGPQQRLRLEAMVAKAATWVAATCTDEAFELMRMGGSRARITVVPPGVDVELYNPAGPQAAKRAKHRIVSVGKLVPRNGFDNVIRALPMIPHAELVIAGGDDSSNPNSDAEAGRLLELANRIGVGRRVHLSGPVARSDMPALLRSADVVACTPWYEPAGTVPLQAMACGVPVVASAVGGMLDTVVHNVTGCLVPPKAPGGWRKQSTSCCVIRSYARALAPRDEIVCRPGIHGTGSPWTCCGSTTTWPATRG